MGRFVAVAAVVALVLAGLWAVSGGAPNAAGPPGSVVDPREVYDPVAAGERLPSGYRQLLVRDAIAPVYAPEFVTADQANWRPGAQVIGVATGDEAKAYPVSFLDRREMVVDAIAGIPILVTW